METSELLKKVRKIEIKTKGLSKHLFSGEYHSAFKGRGMSFSEVRDYQFGDDVRNIDWNVTARSGGGAFIKVFEEERELTVMILVDVSASVFFGTQEQMKNEIITEISAVLAFSAITNNDKVGAILFSDKIEKFIPPKKGKSHILRIIRELLNSKPTASKTDLSVALQYLNNILKKRSTAFILSDFISEDYEQSLNITARRHDIIGLHLYDPMEKELPNIGLVQIKDRERGEVKVIDTSSKKVRTKYQEWWTNHLSVFENRFKKSGADTLSLATDESYVKVLYRFFKQRR